MYYSCFTKTLQRKTNLVDSNVNLSSLNQYATLLTLHSIYPSAQSVQLHPEIVENKENNTLKWTGYFGATQRCSYNPV